MADIQHIQAPEHVIQVEGQPPLDFWAFLRWIITIHHSYNTDAPGIRASVRLERLIAEKPAVLALDHEDHARLREAVEAPPGGYPVRPGSRCLPFVDAVCNAKPAPQPKEPQ